MNAIQCMALCDLYMDVSRNARFYYADYNNAFGNALQNYMDRRIGDETERDPMNFQWNQQIRDDLYTLIANASLSVTNGTVINNKYYSATPSHIIFPTDYYDFISLNVLIDGFTDYSKPITYNQLGPLLKDSFRHPTNIKTYFNEDSTGLTVWRGVGGVFTSAALEYIRQPAPFSVGNESLLINAGTAIVNGSIYIATEISVQNGVTYQIGDQFTTSGTTLTSGQIILASNTQTVDLPLKAHSDVCKIAAEILLGVTSNYQAAQSAKSEI